MLYANALDVVSSTQKNKKAGKILIRHLNMARKEINGLETEISTELQTTDGNTTTGYSSGCGTEVENSGYDSDGNPVVRNKYGAAGSSAYMSDLDVIKIKAPFIKPKAGKKRETRYKPMFERARKGMKRYTAFPVISEDCGEDAQAGNKCTTEAVKNVKHVAKKKRTKRTRTE